MGICPHPPVALRRQFSVLAPQRAVFVEELFGAIAPQPFFEQAQFVGPRQNRIERYLMSPASLTPSLKKLIVRLAMAFPAC